ncbi:response regulator [Phaeodactylibacter xiamenensis]|uniref:response regulator n=1 Tax=Phaeodactylibacter xiamenensis TaxID=1524460 RepID=UPI0024A97BEF|nr:response regulator transcription factor [Phaeodactylibacter xiamenensis]
MIKIALIEDDAAYLYSLRHRIQLQPDIRCLITASSVKSFWETLPRLASIDIVFIDIDMPEMSGIEALPGLRKRFPEANLVMLTQCEDRQALFQAFSNGADGYILKDFPVREFPDLIKVIRDGGALISPKMARWLIAYFQPAPRPESPLTPREEQLLQFFADGHSYEETASLMGITVNGVKYHVKKVYAKLNVDNRIDAIKKMQG